MVYNFNVNGIYVNKTRNRTERCTNVAPPDENETATWVWNHVNWVAMPLGWKPDEAMPTPIETSIEETPSEETPSA